MLQRRHFMLTGRKTGKNGEIIQVRKWITVDAGQAEGKKVV